MFDNLLGRFSEVAELDLFLKAHTGAGYTINRTGRDNIHLHRPILSVAISPSPPCWRSWGRRKASPNGACWPVSCPALPRSRVGHRTLAPTPIDPSLAAAYGAKLTAMAQASLRFDSDQPMRLRLDPKTYETWKTFEMALEPRIGCRAICGGSRVGPAIARRRSPDRWRVPRCPSCRPLRRPSFALPLS